MEKKAVRTLVKELAWLIVIVAISALVEFAIIENFNLHPVLSIKIQGLIGLVVIGYVIRMSVRLWKTFHKSDDINSEEIESSDFKNSRQ